MSYQEKKSITNIISSIVITTVYALIVNSKYQNGDFDTTNIFKFWAMIILIFIGVSVVAKIVSMIVFHIGNEIGVSIKNEITGSDEVAHEDIVDERDKLIVLKTNVVSMYIFIIGFALALVTQLFDVSNHWFFITFVVFGFVADIASEIMTIKYYRKGV